MTTDRLESLMRFHPFTRLNKLLESVQAGGGNTPLALSVGEPQFAPPAMVARLIHEQAPLWGKYPLPTGTEPFRQAVAGWLTRRFRLPDDMVDPARHVMPVTGTREALFHIALSAVPEVGPGEEKPVVLMPNPFYHVYAGAAAAAGAEPYFLNATGENSFLPEIAAIPEAILKRTALAYICSPSNPQGAVAPLSYLCDWLALARRHNFVLASDECYSEIYRGTPPHGALEAARDLGGQNPASLDNLIIFHSLSKRSSGAGMRSGFVAGEARLIQRQAQLINFGGVATPYPILAAATELWQDEEHVQGYRAKYIENFNAAQDALEDIFGEVRAEGGFFLWLDVGDGEAAAQALWQHAAIRVLPGGYMARPDANGMNPGQRYIRVALVLEPAEMSAALKRMAPVLERVVDQQRKAQERAKMV
ncbi:aminotransferase class I/II-fold pyridoxal phosphate-dependent enzyme [Dongia deserti]|uniref:aminotransferase class I/II-fold pyridoxal phosphate-dependent enzyme n=1 Tax=Dongia deserti TaxID=2268030 RepID=UPI000E651DF4|nr:aminotransferase class I/II-fold pyridoxal phosphate-dependent enzyme [Dongia deserti]